jgi:hypothetical protein
MNVHLFPVVDFTSIKDLKRTNRRKSRDSSVGIETRLRATRSDDRGSIPGGSWEFFSSTPCPDGSGAHSASYPMGAEGSFPVIKVAGACS